MGLCAKEWAERSEAEKADSGSPVCRQAPAHTNTCTCVKKKKKTILKRRVVLWQLI